MSVDRATRVRWRDRPPTRMSDEDRRWLRVMNRKWAYEKMIDAAQRESIRANEAARRAEPPMPGWKVALWAVGFYLFVLIVAPFLFSIMTGVSTCNPHCTSGVAPMVEAEQ